ncbi:MAG: hypothetical protein M0P40_09405 [Bacteroidales bacterium]|jgi:hypothetical protein|nr:hypothetical protein [Bacteroidales bacterium]
MTLEDRAVIKQIAQEVVAEMEKTGHLKCSYCTSDANVLKHDRHHEFVEGAIECLNRINNIKWGVLQAVAIAAVFAILTIVGLKIK